MIGNFLINNAFKKCAVKNENDETLLVCSVMDNFIRVIIPI